MHVHTNACTMVKKTFYDTDLIMALSISVDKYKIVLEETCGQQRSVYYQEWHPSHEHLTKR